jgi:hypothetical protein
LERDLPPIAARDWNHERAVFGGSREENRVSAAGIFPSDDFVPPLEPLDFTMG